MSIVIPDTSGVPKTTWQVSLHTYRDDLHATLQKATLQAKQQQQGIIASFTQVIEWYDPLHAYIASQQIDLGDCFFWEKPVEQNAFVGIGCAICIETTGADSFSHAAMEWRNLLQYAVVELAPGTIPTYGSGPTFFGGFAFDPLGSRTELWAGFPDGQLVLPRLLLSYSDGIVSLTMNVMVEEHDDSGHCTQQLIDDAIHLFSTIDAVSSVPIATGVTQDQLVIQDLRSSSEWMEQVTRITHEIRQGTYEKVVLARGVRVSLQSDASETTFSIEATLQRLRQSYPSAYIFAVQRGERYFVGATPERLVQAQDRQIQTMALAGSAPRGTSTEEDEQIGKALLQSEKNSIEHAIVVATVREALSKQCSAVYVVEHPRLLKLKNVQHLETPIVGELRPGCCILDVMADLHPTPAVGGFPRQVTLEAIRQVERLDRGWYAGPLGWIGAGGHGEFAVALRSGLVEGKQAILFAGCGIVADSDPPSEYAESCLKLQVMLRGLGE